VDYSEYLAITCDGDGVIRGIQPKVNVIAGENKLTNIIFPHYSPETDNTEISKLGFKEFSQKIIMNIKYIPDTKDLPKTIKTLYKNCNIYEIKYHDNNSVYSFINFQKIPLYIVFLCRSKTR